MEAVVRNFQTYRQPSRRLDHTARRHLQWIYEWAERPLGLLHLEAIMSPCEDPLGSATSNSRGREVVTPGTGD